MRTEEKMRKLSLVLTSLLVALPVSLFAQGNVIRVGAFPNITHPQAMVGKGNGFFEKAMGPERKD